MAGKSITLDDIAQMIEARDKRFDAIDARFETIDKRFDANDERFVSIEARFASIDVRFKQIDARFDDLKRDVNEVRLEQTKLNKLYEQIFGRVLGIENDIEEIYDRLVMLEEKVPNLTEAEYTETQIKVEKLYYWAHKVALKSKIPVPR